MKTKEELNALKEEIEKLNRKLAELTEEELEEVTGGGHCGIYAGGGSMVHAPTFGESSDKGKIGPDSTKSWFGTDDSGRSHLSGGQQQRIHLAGVDTE